MNHASSLITLLCGAILGAVVILACSDDSPGNADAATCECPAAEPPLAGRIVRARLTTVIDPGGNGVQSVGCPGTSTLLGGSCRLMNMDPRIVLISAGLESDNGQGYRCQWKSSSPVADTGIVDAICLMPAQ